MYLVLDFLAAIIELLAEGQDPRSSHEIPTLIFLFSHGVHVSLFSTDSSGDRTGKLASNLRLEKARIISNGMVSIFIFSDDEYPFYCF